MGFSVSNIYERIERLHERLVFSPLRFSHDHIRHR